MSWDKSTPLENHWLTLKYRGGNNIPVRDSENHLRKDTTPYEGTDLLKTLPVCTTGWLNKALSISVRSTSIWVATAGAVLLQKPWVVASLYLHN